MATKQTILKAFEILKVNYPAYFNAREEEQVNILMKEWANAFETVPDGQLLRAVSMITKKSMFFPTINEADEIIKKQGYIELMNLNTYKKKVEMYKEYETATAKDVDEWVDLHRFLHDDRPWTTKDFYEYRATAKQAVEDAKALLTKEQKEELGL